MSKRMKAPRIKKKNAECGYGCFNIWYHPTFVLFSFRPENMKEVAAEEKRQLIKLTTLAVKKILFDYIHRVQDDPLHSHQMSKQENISNSLRNDMELHIIEIMVINIISKMAPFSTSLYRGFLLVTTGLSSRSSASSHLNKCFNIKICFLGVCPVQKTL